MENSQWRKKGKSITIDSDKEAKDSLIYVEEVNPEEDPIQPVRQPKYVLLGKGKVKVPANLDEFDTVIPTPALPIEVQVENLVVRHVVAMKFEH